MVIARQGGFDIGLVQRRFGREAVKAAAFHEGDLIELAIDTKETLGPVGLTTRADTIPTPTMQMFMNCIRSTAERLEKKMG